MSAGSHFTKKVFQACDRESDYLKGVFSANRYTIRTVIGEFNRVLDSRGISENQAIKELRALGGIITRNTLNKMRKGEYYTASTTFLNILSRYAGYKDFIDLAYHVRSRELGLPT